ncbi:MAG: roadblock/LC7 domain-containing protein [Gemmatimonadaceae bacterium]|nr:roadblock/LC7 domain-containing protein [Gemmatimonadaceae bacterium]
MPTIHDLVRALAQRDGVEAVVILGRDGLLIDTRTNGALDGEHLAALTPAVATAAEQVGRAAGRGALVTVVLEYERGHAIVSAVSADALLLIVVHPSAHLGSLLYDLRRHRANIASLV